MDQKVTTTLSYRVKDTTKQRADALGVLGKGDNVDADTSFTKLLDAYENSLHQAEADSEQSEMLNALAQKLQCPINEVNEKLTAFQEEHDQLIASQKELNERHEQSLAENELLKAEIKQLQVACNQIDWEKIKKSMKPFVVDLLELTARKLSDKYNQEVTPMKVMVEMFLRYTIERWNQWFYPFVVKDDEIIRLAQQYNHDIKSISQLKSIVL